jgi:hypothetical protein
VCAEVRCAVSASWHYVTENDPALLWQYYTQLVVVEEAFKNLKGDLAIRPVFHQHERRIEAHIFIAFLANPPGHTSVFGASKRRANLVAPGGRPARSAYNDASNQASSGVQG